MAHESQLWARSATELAANFADGACAPDKVLESVIDRINAINPRINAVVTCDFERARQAASDSTARWRAGAPLSALDGVPITVKDNIAVAGIRATWGSALFADYVPEADELPIARLRAAGAIVVGKTNCPEFTVQGYTDNALFGPTRNPFDLALTPGGSSGGAVAAVSSGICPIAIATDGGGSIRRPASYTGLVGLKPSRGRVARAGGFAAILHDCEVIGPIARSVADVRQIMRFIGQPHASDPLSLPMAGRDFSAATPRPCRVLYIPQFGDSPVDPVIAQSVGSAAGKLASFGHFVEEGAVPFELDALGHAWGVISQTGLQWLSQRHPDWSERVGEDMQLMAQAGAQWHAAEYYESLSQFSELKRALAKVFEHYDLIMTPSAAAMPWPAREAYPARIDERGVGPRGHAIFTGFVNMSGCAAINLPAAPAPGGMPIGFQLVGPVGADKLLCDVGEQYESHGVSDFMWPAF